MSSLTYLLPARQDLKRYTHSAMTPLGVLAVASLMAATTTLGRYLIGYILLEAIYLIYYRLRPHLEGTHDASQISTSTPGLGLWKDILIALDDGESTVDQWISFVFGVMVDQVRRENVEVLLAESIFCSSLDQLRDDPLKYHALNKAVTELEIRRNRRFAAGRNQDVQLPIQYRHQKPATQRTRVKFLAELLLDAVVRFALHWFLVLAGFQSSRPGVFVYHQPRSNGKADSPVVILAGTTWSQWRMLPIILGLRRSATHPVYVLAATGRRHKDPESVESLSEILSPTTQNIEPILVVDRDSIVLASNLLKDVPKSHIVLIDPSIHPLMMIALDPALPASTRIHENSDIALLASRNFSHVLLTPSTSIQHSGAMKRYCELKSIPCLSTSSTSYFDSSGLSDVVLDACQTVKQRTAVVSDLTSPKTVEVEITPDETLTPRELITLLNSSAMMSTLENISSIGMCLAPPLRTRQRSKSMGMVVGYGHVDGMRRPSAVAVGA